MYILYVFVLTPDVYSLIVVKQDISRLYPTNQGKEGKTMTASGVIEREPRVAREAIARERVALRPATQKRLSINLPIRVFNELQELADLKQRSMTELIRDAFALTKIAYEETEQGNKIAILDSSGKTLKELIIAR